MKSESEMLNVMMRYCSLAERCLFDVRRKMQSEGLPAEAAQRIVNKLLAERFIDECRFSQSFVHDKFRLNHWGRVKIRYELQSRGIPSEVYESALESISEDEYQAVLAGLLAGKNRTVKGRSSQEVFQKLCRFAAARGFETALVIHQLKKMLKNVPDETCD